MILLIITKATARLYAKNVDTICINKVNINIKPQQLYKAIFYSIVSANLGTFGTSKFKYCGNNYSYSRRCDADIRHSANYPLFQIMGMTNDVKRLCATICYKEEIVKPQQKNTMESY